MSRNKLSSPFRRDSVGKTNNLGADRALSRIENNNRKNNRNVGIDPHLITKEETIHMNKNNTSHTTTDSPTALGTTNTDLITDPPTRALGLMKTKQLNVGLNTPKASAERQLDSSFPTRLQTIIEIEEDAEEVPSAKEPRASTLPLSPWHRPGKPPLVPSLPPIPEGSETIAARPNHA